MDFKEYEYVYVTGYSLEASSSAVVLEELESVFKSQELNMIFDPSPRIKHYTESDIERVLSLCPIIHGNAEEIKYMSGQNDSLKGALEINKITDRPVIVTLGGAGSLYVENQLHKKIDAPSLEVTDTIGAGDSHTAGFIAGLIAGKSIEECCRQGNAVAGQAVQTEGSKVNLNMT